MEGRDAEWSPWPGRVRTALIATAVAAAIVGVLGAIVAARWRAEAVALADAHVQHEVAHAGWSFPARIVAADTPRVLAWLVGPDGELREHLPLADAPKHLIDAILAAEDRDFRAHGGVSWGAVIRAFFANTTEGGYVQGGSTIDMQVVRAFTRQREKKLLRKLREIVMAGAIDDHLGKDGVLQVYLDAPYLGQRGSYSVAGFQAASRHYFGKDAERLSLAEAATLASILPAPARFAPDRHPARAKERRDRLLKTLGSEFGYDVEAALAEPVKTVEPEALPELHPAYLSFVRSWLESRLSDEVLYGAGLVITASVELGLQAATEALFEEKLELYEKLIAKKPKDGAPLQAAAVLLDVETREVRALYAGRDVEATHFNRATQARRQGGSAFKPVVYAMAMAEKVGPGGQPRFTAASIEPNSPKVFKTAAGDWHPRNIGGEYSPTASLAHALTWSQNIATASLLEELGGPKRLIAQAARLGFDTKDFKPELGLALGQAEVTPLEMATFAGIIASGGLAREVRPVVRAVDARGRERIAAAPEATRVLDAEAAALTRELMRMVVDFGTGGTVRGAGGEAGYSGPVLGKTGTTDGEKDLWFIGATPRYAGAVWLGYDLPSGLAFSASDLAAPLFGWWLHRITAKDGKPPTFAEEPKLSHRWICSVTGRLANESCKSLYAPFVPGTEPRDHCGEAHSPALAHGEPVIDPETGESTKPVYESLWKRLAREKAESELQ